MLLWVIGVKYVSGYRGGVRKMNVLAIVFQYLHNGGIKKEKGEKYIGSFVEIHFR